MIKEDIQKLYLRLSNDFAQKPFDQVMDEIREIRKKYFSCFPLLFQIGALLMNHYMLAKESQQQEVVLEAIDLFSRIKTESDDFTLCRKSNVMEATCYIILAEPVKTIELLADAKTPMLNENNLLSMGYSMSGKPDKAKEILQIEIYQNFLNIMQSLTALLQLEIADAQASKNIIDRINCLSDAFQAPQLHPATMLSVYLNLAAAFVMQNDADNALAALQQYCELAVGISYPISLHGDSFFDRIDEWLSELDLGVHAPRDDKAVRQGIIDGVAKNPVFSVLADHVKYQHIVEKLTTALGG